MQFLRQHLQGKIRFEGILHALTSSHAYLKRPNWEAYVIQLSSNQCS